MAEEKILVVDDEEGIRGMVELYLKKRGYIVETAENGKNALQKVTSFRPDLILLDIEMPGINGFEVCKQIRMELMVPIIFLSVRKRTIDKVKCFELGGDDYLTKPFEFKELEARIRANLRLYRIDPNQQQNILKFDDLEIHIDQYKCYVGGNQIDLSKKEMALLIHLAQNPNRVWSPEQLYDHIWSLDATGNIETVKVHISTLRRKIERDRSNPKYINTVRGFGYLFSEKGFRNLS